MTGTASRRPLDCPSAQPEMTGARVLGVVERDETGKGTVAYLNARQPVTQEVLDACGDVPPTEVLRFAAPCEESRCQHFDGSRCQLAARVVEGMARVVDRAPPCAIRKTCRWHAQEGLRACLRCPQVATRIAEPDPHLMAVAGVRHG